VSSGFGLLLLGGVVRLSRGFAQSSIRVWSSKVSEMATKAIKAII